MGDNEYHRIYNINRYHRIRAEEIAAKGGECVDCGSTDKLEFDHVDPKLKSFDVGKLLNYSAAKRKAELEKCVLRCKACHKIKTTANGDNGAVGHGGGLTGKRNCYCELCAPLKAEYMRNWKKKKNKV